MLLLSEPFVLVHKYEKLEHHPRRALPIYEVVGHGTREVGLGKQISCTLLSAYSSRFSTTVFGALSIHAAEVQACTLRRTACALCAHVHLLQSTVVASLSIGTPPCCEKGFR